MLRLTLIGHLGADAEMRTSQKGAAMATFSVAVNQVRNDTTTGERQEQTEWFRVRAMGRLASFAERLSKGQRVLVVGRLDVNHYQSREGEERIGFDVWADEVVALSPPRDTEAEGPTSATVPVQGTRRTAPPASAGTSTRRRPPVEDASTEEDLPF